MHYSGALYIIHYISCVINLRRMTQDGYPEDYRRSVLKQGLARYEEKLNSYVIRGN